MPSTEAPITPEIEADLRIAKRGCSELLVESEFVRKLARSHATGKPLRIKLGLDPTAPDIHLGHTVVLNKMRQLQDLGHTVIFLIGDFTSMIGDPSGRNATRPPLTREQIEANAKTLLRPGQPGAGSRQAPRSATTPNGAIPLGARGMIQLASRYTVARMMERDDFTKRFKGGVPISVHEFLYPLMQGYDSVALKSDLELGGTDQKFNLLVGRELQKEYGQEPQCILTMPLLEGIDGVEKMSKSKGNYIGITEAPDSMFGKLMSISDTLMWRYFELLSFRSLDEIAPLQAARSRRPQSARRQGDAGPGNRGAASTAAAAAEQALADFEARFREAPFPTTCRKSSLAARRWAYCKVLREAGLVCVGRRGPAQRRAGRRPHRRRSRG